MTISISSSWDDLEIGYPCRALFRIAHFRANSRELIGIEGENGCGKSTLLKSLAGLLALRAGSWRIIVDGTSRSPGQALRQGCIIYLPQRRNTFLTLSVRQNLETIARTDAARAAKRAEHLWPPGAEFVARNLTRRLAQMSGGERQIVALTSCLASQARILLLDEPSEGLSGTLRHDLLSTLRRAAVRDDRLIICVDHNVLALRDHSHRTYEVGGEVLSQRLPVVATPNE